MNRIGQVSCLLLLLLTACTSQPSAPQEPAIAATFFPLEEITKQVVGNTATVYSVIPAGIEPHDYEPAPKDIAAFQRASTFITLGLEFEHVEQALLASRDQAPVVILAVENIDLRAASGGNSPEPGVGAMTEQYDPHVWLSIPNMITMTKTVAQELSKQNPDLEAQYNQNAASYITELELLHQRYKTELASCKTRTLLVNHQAFGYLAQEYDLVQIPISGISPDAEPTPGDLAALIDLARAHNVKAVFTEELVDSRIAQTIAEDVGAKTLLLSPAEGSLIPSDTYISIMQRNLNNLKEGLDCK